DGTRCPSWGTPVARTCWSGPPGPEAEERKLAKETFQRVVPPAPSVLTQRVQTEARSKSSSPVVFGASFLSKHRKWLSLPQKIKEGASTVLNGEERLEYQQLEGRSSTQLHRGGSGQGPWERHPAVVSRDTLGCDFLREFGHGKSLLLLGPQIGKDPILQGTSQGPIMFWSSPPMHILSFQEDHSSCFPFPWVFSSGWLLTCSGQCIQPPESCCPLGHWLLWLSPCHYSLDLKFV
ncbi:unnamed protein product, partial [Gulo gulo]